MDVRGQDFELIPFGAGRRICLGLPLASRTLSVMLGSLLNSFDWKVEGDIVPEDLDAEDVVHLVFLRYLKQNFEELGPKLVETALLDCSGLMLVLVPFDGMGYRACDPSP
ncbi:hypothetical protein MTR67_010582 [Solanum verrucosum]|uniref:Uncharacterized protein n=1 Tax=Solanum verrucosum TaxID=315347 RepID=A0AAF0TEB7_SOLVR|nr:hypothetical protein MTR67_010582 [Solanum verrucosum]